jgi:hypothetical protein
VKGRDQVGAPPAPAVTINVEAPPHEVKVCLAPPPFVWTDSDEGTLAWACGMRRDVFAATLREMLCDPDHGGRVINLSAKRRGVAVDDFIAYLRARSCPPPAKRDTKPANDAGEAAPLDGVDAVLASIGAERVPSRGRAGR